MKKILSLLFCFIFSLSELRSQTNLDFEATTAGIYTSSNSISGWTLTSQTATSCNTSTVWVPGSPEFSIVNTPVLSFPFIGNIVNSPIGGTKVARLNNSIANSSVTRLVQTFSVSTANTLFQFAYAGIWEDGGHPCCEQASFKFRLYDGSGTLVTCPSYSLAGVGCPNVPSYSTTIGTTWTSWVVQYIDLTPYINTNITIEVIANDCAHNDHYGTIFFDAKTQGQLPCGMCDPGFTPQSFSNSSFCPGSSVAEIKGPIGYAQYSWAAPAGYPISAAQSSLAIITVTNAMAGNIYTLTVIPASGNCLFTQAYTLTPSTVSIIAIGSSSTCSGGSSGSATVIASGSGSGYNYAWSAATNTLISSSQTASNLIPGIYSVAVTAAGSQSALCGSATTTVLVTTAPPSLISILKPYCNGAAILSAPGGSNYRWYINYTLVPPASGGTLSSLSISSPTNGMLAFLGYLSSQGCQDSVKFTLLAVNPGTLNITSNPTICLGATNGKAVIQMVPASGAPPGTNSFVVSAIGATPPYSASVNPTSATAFTATSLFAGGTYSINASDGTCTYASTFSVPSISFNYSLTTNLSPTLCPGGNLLASVAFGGTVSPAQYTYSWSPATFLFGSNMQSVIVSPTVSPGSTALLIYSVVVTPSVATCPLTKTISVTVINPPTTTVTSIPNLCSNSPNYLILTNPPGGFFSTIQPGLSQAGMISPTICSMGSNTFTYTPPQQGFCSIPSVTASFNVNPQPFIDPSGNILQICSGQTSTLNVSGNSSTYSWNTGSTGPQLIVTPSVTTSYTVSGTSANLCSSQVVLTVTVVPTPTVSIAGNTIACLTQTTTLTASGANSYLWSNGFAGSSISISPTSSTSYSVTGTNGQICTHSASIVVNVATPPIISVSGNTSICEGQSTTLLANGASTYTWNNGSTAPFITISPSATSAYTVIGKDAFTSCASSKTIAVSVFPNPTPGISGNKQLCVGEALVLTANGANTYSWSTGILNSSVSLSPIITSGYTLTGINTAGPCSASLTFAVIVSECTGIHSLPGKNENTIVSPNPGDGEFFLELSEQTRILVIDATGKIVFEKNFDPGKHKIDLQSYPDGIYFLRLTSVNETKNIKLVKDN